MTHSRFTFEPAESTVAALPQGSAFLLMSAAPQTTPQSAMQWLYQRLYEEAAKANTPTPSRDLFSVMN